MISFSIADTLQELKLPVISTEECRRRTIFLPLYKISDSQICAGWPRGGKDACLGDSVSRICFSRLNIGFKKLI